MLEQMNRLLSYIKNSNRLEGIDNWAKETLVPITEKDRPIDYIVEGGPFLRGTIGLLILGAIVVISWGISTIFTDTMRNRISLFSVGTSLSLSFGLIWVYLYIAQSEQTQASFAEEQTDLEMEMQKLQQDQIDIMGAEFEPIIEILDYGMAESDPPRKPVSASAPRKGDFFHVKISNITDSVGRNLRMRFILDYMGPKGYGGGADIPLSRENFDQTLTAKTGGIVRGKQSKENYHCIAGLTLPMINRGGPLPFSKCLNTLSDNGITHLRVGLVLVYEDRKGKEHEIELEGFELTSSDWPVETLTLTQARKVGEEVPVELVKVGLLEKGFPQIPPRYRR